MKTYVKKTKVAVSAALGMVTLPAMADGFTKAGTLLDKVSSGLLGLSIVTVTIAALWVGYKVLFQGNTLRECAPIIIGAIIIASASEVARLMVG